MTTTSAPATPDYVPGVCNINRKETAYRRRVGIIALAVAVVASLALLSAPRMVRLVLFLPYFIAFICLLQARNHFCVSFAASGQQNASEGGSAAAITDSDARTADKRKARRMNLQAAAAAFLLTLVLAAVPVLSL